LSFVRQIYLYVEKKSEIPGVNYKVMLLFKELGYQTDLLCENIYIYL